MGGLVRRQVGLGITAGKTDARYVKFGATHNVGCCCAMLVPLLHTSLRSMQRSERWILNMGEGASEEVDHRE